MHTGTAVHVDDIQVLGCGVISWKPPRGNEGDLLGYVVRFSDDNSIANGGYRSLQRYFEDIGRQWAIADNLPTDGRTVYAEVSIIYRLFYQQHTLSLLTLYIIGSSKKQFTKHQSILRTSCCCR